MWQGPRALCLCGGEGESLREVRIRWFHSVRWCLLGQRHYGDRSCIAVAFSMWCGLFFLTSYRRGIVFRRRLFGQEKVGSRVILACSATELLQFLSFTRVDASIQPGEG